MAGYDDTKAIEEIRALMLANPEMSRRSAILSVVGDGSLRRIEMKMKESPARPKGPELSVELRRVAREFIPKELAAFGYRSTSGRVTSSGLDEIWVENDRGEDTRFEAPVHGGVRRGAKVTVHHLGPRVMMVENHDTGKDHVNFFAPVAMRYFWLWFGAVLASVVWLVTSLFTGSALWALIPIGLLLLKGAGSALRLRMFAYEMQFVFQRFGKQLVLPS